MNDHATTGGYAIAGTVITADLPIAGQLAPGDWVEFEACTIDAADEALRAAGGGTWRSVATCFSERDARAIRGGADSRRGASRAIHHIQSWRTGRVVSRNEDVRTKCVDALRIAHAAGVRVTLLGGGSNVLIGDRGVRGLVHPTARRAHRADRQRTRACGCSRRPSTASSDGRCSGASPAWRRGRARPARSAARSSATRISAAG